MTTAIIGGGAAGVAAAIAAAERGQRVLVLERNRKPLKKLSVTGNGRGNLLNSGVPVYYGDAAFARDVLAGMGYPQLKAFFEGLGVPLRQENEGWIYPAALQAAVAVEALLLRAGQLGVTFLLNTRAGSLTRENGGFTLCALHTEPAPETTHGKPRAPAVERRETIHADRVIVTVGGAAAPAHGTDGTGYALLTAFGHRLSPLKPALCALLTDPRRIAGLAGQRARASLTLVSSAGGTLKRTEGEVLFGDDAISGIAAMQLARFAELGSTLSMDLRPALALSGAEHGEIVAFLSRLANLRSDCSLADLFTGAFAYPLARLILRESGVGEPGEPIASLSAARLDRLAETIADLRLPIAGTRGFEQAQVTAGGIVTEDFDPATLQSRLCPGLYAAGEVLDVDGDCGGFNLMFAFASGLLAGRG